jgi:transglutaminase-like putative cysteine protease
MFHYPRSQYIGMFAIADGERGIMETVFLMRDLVKQYKVDPQIRATALSLVEKQIEKDAAGEINAIFLFVRDCIRYVMDVYDVETVHTPPKILEIGQGDCDDKSVLLACMLESIGYETAFVLAGYHGSDYEHVYVFVRGHDVAMFLDATEPEDAGWEAPNATVKKIVQ